jgi:hypothetical protein
LNKHSFLSLDVCSSSFSGSGKLLLSLDVDAPFAIAVWRWGKGEEKREDRGVSLSGKKNVYGKYDGSGVYLEQQ